MSCFIFSQFPCCFCLIVIFFFFFFLSVAWKPFIKEVSGHLINQNYLQVLASLANKKHLTIFDLPTLSLSLSLITDTLKLHFTLFPLISSLIDPPSSFFILLWYIEACVYAYTRMRTILPFFLKPHRKYFLSILVFSLHPHSPTQSSFYAPFFLFTLSLTHTLSHSHTHSLTHTHTLSLTHTLSHSLTHTHSLSLSLSHTLSLYLSIYLSPYLFLLFPTYALSLWYFFPLDSFYDLSIFYL